MSQNGPHKSEQSPAASPTGSEYPRPHAVFCTADVEEIQRREGYREIRCIPAHWTYVDPEPLEALVAEHDSGSVSVDKGPGLLVGQRRSA